MEKRQLLLDLVPKPPDWSIDWTKIQDSPVSPWIAQMKTIPQNPVWHGEGDVWTHTCMVCRELTAMPAWRMADRRRQEELFLAALLHDIGKIPCTRMEAGSWISPNHSAVGSRMAREILWLTFGFCGNPDVQSFRETICSLIRYHSLPLHILEQVEPERCAIKTASVGKLARDFSLWMLWILALADMRGRICGDREEALEAVELFRVQAEEAGCLEAPYVFPDPCSEYAYLSGKKIRPGQGFFDDSWGEAILLSEEGKISMKKAFVFLVIGVLLILFTGCSAKEENVAATVDITGIAQFTDEKMEANGCTIIERTISQRTDDATVFVVEYLYQRDSDNGTLRYGYCLKVDDKIFSIISEGEDIDNSILEEKEGVYLLHF